MKTGLVIDGESINDVGFRYRVTYGTLSNVNIGFN
jgi:hypothetical protein